jgi:hypothetical protein
MKAGRLLLGEIRNSIRRKETFALESTLSGKTYVRMLADARRLGFQIHLHYLWLSTPAIAIARVRERVKKGGQMLVRLGPFHSRTSNAASAVACGTSYPIMRRWRNDGRFGTIKAAADTPRRIAKLHDQSTGSYS